METGEINISRAAQKVVYPAEFQLVCAMNPSPTGDIDDQRANPDQVLRYLNRISGPFLDRIDLQVNVPRIDLGKALQVKHQSKMAIESSQQGSNNNVHHLKVTANSDISAMTPANAKKANEAVINTHAPTNVTQGIRSSTSVPQGKQMETNVTQRKQGESSSAPSKQGESKSTQSNQGKVDEALFSDHLAKGKVQLEATEVPKHASELETSAVVKARVIAAQARQMQRQGKLNKSLSGKEIELYCPLSETESLFLSKAMQSMNLSMRAYHRTMRVARTIADLDCTERVNQQHLAEALSFRSFDRMLNELTG
jgi:magnesium chelatase family protein